MTQACDLANGVELRFLDSGIRIRPYEVSTRDERHKFSWANVKTSIEAAELIEERGAFREPVVLEIGSVTQNRYFVPTDGITYGEEQAWIELLDPLKILEDTTIEGDFSNITLGDMVETIFEQREDPNRLLTRLEVLDEELTERASSSRRAQIEEFTGSGRIGSSASWVVDKTTDLVLLANGLRQTEGGFTFDDHTLHDALLELEDTFGVSVWADRRGVMEVGIPEARSINHIPVFGDPSIDDVSISQYNVGTARNSIVRLRGRTSTLTSGGFSTGMTPGNHLKYIFPDSAPRDVHFVAEIKTTEDVDGNFAVLEDPIKVRSQTDLEDSLRRMFVDEYMSHNSGNIEFNSISSDNKQSMAELTVGDYISVAPEIEQVCGRGVSGGTFVVTRVLQNVNTRVGWKTTAEVTRVAPDIEVNSWVYDYKTDSTYEDIDQLNEEA